MNWISFLIGLVVGFLGGSVGLGGILWIFRNRFMGMMTQRTMDDMLDGDGMDIGQIMNKVSEEVEEEDED